MADLANIPRHFLFLQGPHGPFFDRLGRMLRTAGARTTRVGFNAGDAFFWRRRQDFVAFQDRAENWPDMVRGLIKDRAITDVVLYGDTRPIHRVAAAVAREYGLKIHVFEEGYLRPFWATYERGGSNGHSRLMDLSVAQMRDMMQGAAPELANTPDHWGDLREHIFYGAIYHWFVLFRNTGFRNFKSHRSTPVKHEFMLYLRRLAKMPLHRAERFQATVRIKRGGFPYHLVLLQLAHDESFRAHSRFTEMDDFLSLTISEFARGAPAHHHLVFKAHPLEDGRIPLSRKIRELTKEHGLNNRIHFVRGGKLAGLLDGARSSVTTNSTSAQQALWRGLPLRAFGDAVFCKPELVSHQPLADFFADPQAPDHQAYLDFRRFLLATSQVSGGFYSNRSRRQLLRNIVDMMLRDQDPYDALNPANEARAQQLKLVK